MDEELTSQEVKDEMEAPGVNTSNEPPEVSGELAEIAEEMRKVPEWSDENPKPGTEVNLGIQAGATGPATGEGIVAPTAEAARIAQLEGELQRLRAGPVAELVEMEAAEPPAPPPDSGDGTMPVMEAVDDREFWGPYKDFKIIATGQGEFGVPRSHMMRLGVEKRWDPKEGLFVEVIVPNFQEVRIVDPRTDPVILPPPKKEEAAAAVN